MRSALDRGIPYYSVKFDDFQDAINFDHQPGIDACKAKSRRLYPLLRDSLAVAEYSRSTIYGWTEEEVLDVAAYQDGTHTTVKMVEAALSCPPSGLHGVGSHHMCDH
ncbi:hypothetical protein I5L01_15915, partial [Erythrobacter sp. YJ-T3-07]|uniref:hypothetical protein n=1 Tax=Erythrobacter sp. YJ-T3-07 TaxID=2793063 RepID=UPI0018D4B331